MAWSAYIYIALDMFVYFLVLDFGYGVREMLGQGSAVYP